MTKKLSRRRFIAISAAAGAGLWASSAISANGALQRWRGTALGAETSLLLHHPDSGEARRLIAACKAEIDRLEGIFSLFRETSAVAVLNREGGLEHPPVELLQALGNCRRISELTDGAFDISVQPLWQLYAGHFSDPGADPSGPTASQITAARDLVDQRRISFSAERIQFSRPGMALTLNGYAQGFITDRIAVFLRREGMTNVLVDIGETRALGQHPEGRPWRVGIKKPDASNGIARELAMSDRAVATSGGYGLHFDKTGRHHHLFDPRTGRSPGLYASVSVIAKRAATADALSTALSALPVSAARRCLRLAGADKACYLRHDGDFEDVTA